MCKAGLSEATAKDVKIWLDYALGDGQAVAPELQYAPLPAPDPRSREGQGRGPAVQRDPAGIARG